MKRVTFILCIVLSLGILTSCASSRTNKDEIIDLFRKNETLIAESIESGDFSEVEKLGGVEAVYEHEDYIEFYCRGSGFGPSTGYYGFFYSEADVISSWHGGTYPSGELVLDGGGYRWSEKDGDNTYYVEPLGGHFYYYEAHF